MRTLFVLSLLTLFAACGLAPKQMGGDILVVGDSVLAWNRSSSEDVGSVIGSDLGRKVVSRATFGARIRAGSLGALGGLSISRQLSAGPWDWIVINGGANDLGACGCTRCANEIDLLISADGTAGAIPELIAMAKRQGARVLWVGYYQAPESNSFGGCRPGLVELERRIAIHARSQEGVTFVDSEDVFDPTDTSLFSGDQTHPSAAGSAVIGRFLAQQIAGRQGAPSVP